MFDALCIGLFVFIATPLCPSTAKLYQQNVSTENVLRKHIFSNYDKVVIPTTRGSNLKVNMRMMIKSAELDYEKSQMILSTWFIAKGTTKWTFSAKYNFRDSAIQFEQHNRGNDTAINKFGQKIYVRLHFPVTQSGYKIRSIIPNWIDDRLTWDPDEYEQMNSIIVDHREIWHPDVMAFNNVDANMEDDRTRVNSVLNSTGSVIWVEPVQYSIHCQTDTTHWPHDTQTGVLRLGSWMYLGNVLNLTTDDDGVEVASSHSEWKIINVYKERHVRNYPCCPEEQYIDIEYNIVIRRNVHPYWSVLYVPAICSALFNLITFWLPYTDNYCKLFANLFNAIFVALTILILYSKLPIVTSTIPLIVVYYTYSLGLIAVTTVMSVVIKGMCAVSKPLPHGVTQFLHSGYLVYLGIETNDLTTDCHVLCESEEMNAQASDLNERRKFAKTIDRICFVSFAFVYLILLLRYMP